MTDLGVIGDVEGSKDAGGGKVVENVKRGKSMRKRLSKGIKRIISPNKKKEKEVVNVGGKEYEAVRRFSGKGENEGRLSVELDADEMEKRKGGVIGGLGWSGVVVVAAVFYWVFCRF